MDFDEYRETSIEYSGNVVSDDQKKRKLDERRQNRFNYYNAVIATLAFLLSVISLILQLC